MRLTIGTLALALAATPAAAAPLPAGVAAFLRAADRNDFAAMQAVMDSGGPAFVAKVRNCYLRRVYSNPQTGEVVAAWMCAEGSNRSRVVLADLTASAAGKASVVVSSEQTNDRPAPPRAGSAFGP